MNKATITSSFALLVVALTTATATVQAQSEAPSAEEVASWGMCAVRGVEGMESHGLTRPTLAEARDAYRRSCSSLNGQRFLRDCDPMVNNDGYICSSVIIGAGAPGGMRDGEVAGFAPSPGARGGNGVSDWQNQGSVPTTPLPFDGGSSNPGTTIQYPGSSSAGKIGSGDLLALHYDNCPDPDDGHAMASATAIIATYGLNNVIVINGTCGNTIKNLFDDDSKRVADAIFPAHLDADANWSSAVGVSAARWLSTLQSGKDIWVAEGGPSDFTADVVKTLERTNPSLDLKRITVVQHAHGPSSWNEGKTDGSNLAYVKNKTSYVTVANGNQANATANLNEQSNFFVNAALSSDYAAEWQSAFNYLPPTRKLDFSDTVELLYLVNDTSTKTVDAFATRYIVPTRPTGVVITETPQQGINPINQNSNGVIMIEAESITPTEGWQIKNAVAGHTGSGYIEWVGANRFFEREARPGNVYTFTLERGGNYEFRFRSRIMQGNNATEHNDTWVNFPSGRNINGEEPLNGYTKAYMGPLNQWSWVTATVDGQGKKLRQYFGPGTHTVMLSGRSTGHAVDRIALFEYSRVSFNAATFDNINPVSRDTGSLSVATAEETQQLEAQSVASANASSDVTAVTVATAEEVDPEVAALGSIDANIDEGQPRYLAPFVDTQGFITTRISDYKTFEGTPNSSVQSSPRRQVWSPNGEYMLVGGRILNSQTKELVSTKVLPAEAIWSGNDEDTIHYLDADNSFMEFKVSTETETGLFRLPHANGLCSLGNGEGSFDSSGNSVVISCLASTDGSHRLYSVDLSADLPLVADFDSLPNLLWAAISPTGSYILAQYGDQVGGEKRLQRYTKDFSQEALLSTSPNSGDFAFDDKGNEVYVMVNDDNFSYIRVDDGQEVILNAPFRPGFGSISCQSVDRQTCLYSTYSTNQLGTFNVPAVSRVGDTRQVIELNISVDPWGNHHATSSNDATQARAVISPDSSKAVFASDRGGQATVASYLIEKVSANGQNQAVTYSTNAVNLQDTNTYNLLTID